MKKCTYCESTDHTQFYCRQKPRKPLIVKKAINRVGPITAQWIETRHQWIQQNATPTGYWTCYICPQRLGVVADPDNNIQVLTLDHIKSRGRHPELRFELSNLAPCCARCNSDKGSLSLEEYLERRDEYARYKSGRATQ
jgi:predicted metal-binding transcription factor (methanogenesis marker protein 9)